MISEHRSLNTHRSSVHHQNFIQRNTHRMSQFTATFCLLNAQSVRNKVKIINDHIIEHDINICALTETWLTEHGNGIVSDLHLEGSEFLHIDHNERTGGGVAVLCKSSTHPVMSTASKFSSYECMHVRQTILNLAVVYQSPQAATSVFLNEFLRYPDELNTADGRLLIVGDFNFHMDDCENSSSVAFHKFWISLG